MIVWNRFLQYINLSLSAYVWGVHVTGAYDTEESLSFFKLFTVFLFANLLATYPSNLLNFSSNWRLRLILESVVILIQSYIGFAFYSSVKYTVQSCWSIGLNIAIISTGINLASMFPITSDFFLIVTQYVANAVYTYKNANPSFLSYFCPLWLLGEAVVMSFGISQLQKCRKCRQDNFQAILGLNDSQLFYVLLVFFALLINSLDYFQGIGHLTPLLTFPLVIPAVYTQLDCNHEIAKLLTLIFFLLYTVAYHMVKIIICRQQLTQFN